MGVVGGPPNANPSAAALMVEEAGGNDRTNVRAEVSTKPRSPTYGEEI